MRLYLKLTPNREVVPFNYQQFLVGAFHKWLGENELHNDISLYSLSWLDGGSLTNDRKGFDFRNGATFCISSPLTDLHKAAVDGIFKDQDINWGMYVSEVTICPTPKFGKECRFLTKSPVLIKRSRVDGQHQQYFFNTDPESGTLMTETLKNKMDRFGIQGDIQIAFDSTYRQPKIRKIEYHGIDIKATSCPVIIQGDPAAIQFAWDVGVGNSTGIGFGCLS